jgi:hypothetical protein
LVEAAYFSSVAKFTIVPSGRGPAFFVIHNPKIERARISECIYKLFDLGWWPVIYPEIVGDDARAIFTLLVMMGWSFAVDHSTK